MRVVFMGTPRFAACVLEYLLDSAHEVIGVFTRPDAVRGRGKELVASPVKQTAQRASVPIFEYASLQSDKAYGDLVALCPDVICVAAYGAFLPLRVLKLPRQGCLNVHASLLPRWRGAAPVERAILAGDKKTGISIMRMEEELDAGDTCTIRTLTIGTTPANELSDQLAHLGGRALVETLDLLTKGAPIRWVSQSVSGITYARKIQKAEIDLGPELCIDEARRRVQASGESHTSRCVIAGRGVTMLEICQPEGDVPQIGAGVVKLYAKRLYLGFSDGVLEVVSLKPDGKRPMDAQAFAAGIQGIKQGGITWHKERR